MKDPKSGKGTLKQILTAAAAVGMVSPMMVATPAAAEVESAQSKIAFLRGLVAAKAEVAVEHPVLQKAVEAAQFGQDQDKEAPDHTNGHTNVHTNRP